MIKSFYENSFPVRFGIILYSTKFIKKIEMSGGELLSSAFEDDSQIGDKSTLVLPFFQFGLMYFHI